jgi:hypothetical protein
LVIGGALALFASVWWLAQVPTPRPVDLPPMKMHVAEVVPTDATFREPTRAFSGGTAYWRVAIRDVHERPVADARVHVDLLSENGEVRARSVMTTGTDGLARFTYALRPGLSGVYTVRVVDVSHVNRAGAAYDRAANSGWSNSFSVP